MNKTFKKIWNAVSTLIVAIIVALAILLVGVRLVGLQVFTVLSGSMEPTYHVGSLIYVKDADYKELEVGDPVTFMLNKNTVATHRIIEILVDENDPDTISFFTKGDTNDTPDGNALHYKDIIGTPVFTIPYLGYVSHYIQNPPGTYIAITLAAIFVALTFVPDLLFSDDGKRGKEKISKEDKTSDKK